jgi:hypothetical protein
MAAHAVLRLQIVVEEVMSHFAYLDDIKAPALEAPMCALVHAVELGF